MLPELSLDVLGSTPRWPEDSRAGPRSPRWVSSTLSRIQARKAGDAFTSGAQTTASACLHCTCVVGTGPTRARTCLCLPSEANGFRTPSASSPALRTSRPLRSRTRLARASSTRIPEKKNAAPGSGLQPTTCHRAAHERRKERAALANALDRLDLERLRGGLQALQRRGWAGRRRGGDGGESREWAQQRPKRPKRARSPSTLPSTLPSEQPTPLAARARRPQKSLCGLLCTWPPEAAAQSAARPVPEKKKGGGGGVAWQAGRGAARAQTLAPSRRFIMASRISATPRVHGGDALSNLFFLFFRPGRVRGHAFPRAPSDPAQRAWTASISFGGRA